MKDLTLVYTPGTKVRIISPSDSSIKNYYAGKVGYVYENKRGYSYNGWTILFTPDKDLLEVNIEPLKIHHKLLDDLGIPYHGVDANGDVLMVPGHASNIAEIIVRDEEWEEKQLAKRLNSSIKDLLSELQ